MDASKDTASMRERERRIGDFATRILGRTASRVARMKAFETNEVYDVVAAGRRYIVKASTHDASRAEAWACARGANVGFAAPGILGFAAIDERTSAFVMPRIDGEPIPSGHPALREVGTRLRELHRVTLPRFGALAEVAWHGRALDLSFSDGAFAHDTTNASRELPCRLHDASWLDYLRRICTEARRIGTPGAIAAADAATTAVDAHVGTLAAVSVGSLCHADLKTAHILVDGTRLAAVIDWGDAAVADPLWDIARFGHRADAASFALLLDGYDPNRTLAGELARRLPLYSALWMMVDANVDHRLGHSAEVPLDSALRYLAPNAERLH